MSCAGYTGCHLCKLFQLKTQTSITATYVYFRYFALIKAAFTLRDLQFSFLCKYVEMWKKLHLTGGRFCKAHLRMGN